MIEYLKYQCLTRFDAVAVNFFSFIVTLPCAKSNNLCTSVRYVFPYWVASHANLTQNELTDKAAKLAADNAANNAKSHVSLSTLNALTRRNTRRKWQRAWNRSDTGLHELFPGYKSLHHHPAESKLIRVLSGHFRLNNHMHRLGLADNPCCESGPARQTVSCVLMDCPLLSTQR